MARQQKKNNKKVRLAETFGEMKDVVIRRATVAIVALIFVLVLGLLVKAFLYRSDYFRLRVVETKAAFLDHQAALTMNNRLAAMHRGRNVFSIPLQSIAQTIHNSYADIKDVAVRIALPDKLVIDLKLRRPVAFLHTTRFYPIDEDGVVLPPVGYEEIRKDLPAIDGIDPHYSKKGQSRNLKLALGLLQEINQSRLMQLYGVSVIHAADPRSMSFSLKNGLEVKIGSEDFKNRLSALVRTLKDPRLVVDKIEYIDVRFEDVVIGPK